MKHPTQTHRESFTVNDRFALFVYKNVGTMWCAYLFTAIGVGSIVGYMINNALLGLLCGAVSSYLIQLVLLPVIMVGQRLDSRHSELAIDFIYHAVSVIEEKVDLLIEKS